MMEKFANLSQRERLLVLAVAGLVPAVLAMFLFFNVSSGLADRADRIEFLQNDQHQLQLRLAAARRAVNRGAVYRKESLPSNTVESLMDYQSWLAEQAQQAFGAASFTVTLGHTQTVRYNMNETVYVRQAYTLTTIGTLRQVTDFLYAFYGTKVLHRINALTLTPETEGQGTRARPTGRLRTTLNIEVAVLDTAERDREFTGEQREDMLRTLEEYHNVVTRRNLFGPPNEPPAFTTAASHDFETGEDIGIPLEVRDDQTGPLKFELIETSAPDAKLEDLAESSARFSVPALPRGTHQFVVRVTDNGWPNKSQDLALRVSVDDPAPEVIRTPDPPPKYARFAVVSGITTNVAGQREVWIKLRQPEDRLLRLVVGDSFELDELTWNVREILDDQVVIDVDGERRTYRVRSTLSEPASATTTTAASH